MPSAYQNMVKAVTENPITGAGETRYISAYNLGTLTLRDIAGAAKMGFTSLSQAEAFSNARDDHPNLERLFTRIGNAAVPLRRGANGDENKIARTANGNPIATNLDPVMSAFGDKYRNDRRFLANLSTDIRENPRLEDQIVRAATEHPTEFAASMRTYNGSANQIETTLNRLLSPAPAPRAQPAAAPRRTPAPERETRAPAPRAQPAAAAPPPARESRPDPSPAPATAPPTSDAPAVTAAPVAASAAEAGVDDAYNGADPPPPTGRIEGSAGIVADDISKEGGIADQIAGLARGAMPDMENDIVTFQNRLKADTPEGQSLRERIAANLNANPEFVQQMMELGGGGEQDRANVNRLLNQYGRESMRDLLNGPEQLADDAYIDTLSQRLSAASGGGGFFQNIMGFIEGIVGPELMQAIRNLFSGFGDMIAGLGQGGNFLSMGNGGIGGMFQSLTTGAAEAGLFGAAQGGLERNAISALTGRGQLAVDRNNDGRFDDADKIDFTDADGNKHRGFETGAPVNSYSQGRPVQFVVTEVNERGQPIGGSSIIVRGTEVAVLDTETGQPRTPAGPREEPAQRRVGGNPTNPNDVGGINLNMGVSPPSGAGVG